MRTALPLSTVALAAVLTACSGSTTAHDPTTGSSSAVTLDDLATGAWVASAPDGLAGPDGPLVAHSRVTLAFTDGELHASAGCNSLTGKAAVEDGQLVVTGLGGTEMACADALMAQEEWFSGFLAASPAVALSTGDTLTLTGDDDTLTLTRLTDEASP